MLDWANQEASMRRVRNVLARGWWVEGWETQPREWSHLLSDSERASDKDVGRNSEKDLDSYMSLSGENSIVTGQSISQRQLENALKTYFSKKFEEINESQIPGTVHSLWYTIQQTVFMKSQSKITQRSLPPSVGGDFCLNTSQELSFLESSAQQMLEAHITKFHMRMLWGLPAKVLESIEIFKLKDTSLHSLLIPTLFLQTTWWFLRWTPKLGASHPLKEAINLFMEKYWKQQIQLSCWIILSLPPHLWARKDGWPWDNLLLISMGFQRKFR